MQVFKDRGPSKVRIGASAPFGWWPAVVLSLVAFMDRVEQSVLAGAVDSIKDYFDVGNFAVGLIATMTGIAGVVLFIPAGRLADRTTRTKALAFVLLSWSILSIGSGLAMTFAMLLAMRTLIGAAGQLNNPAASSLLGDYYPGKSRTKVFGIERLVYFLGNPIGVILGGVISKAFGWQWVFIGLVIPGLVIAAFCWFLREPVRGTSDRIDAIRAGADPDDVLAGLVERESDVSTTSVKQDMFTLWRIPTLRLIYVCQAALYFGLGGMFFFTATFFTDVFDVEADAAGAFAGSIGTVGIAIGAGLGITVANRFEAGRAGWRVSVAAIGLLVGTIGVGILAVASTIGVAVAGFLVVNTGFMIAIPNLAAAVADLCTAFQRGIAFSVNQLVIGVFGALGPSIIGLNADLFGFNAAYGLMMPPLLVAAVVAWRARLTYDRDVAAAVQEGTRSPTEREVSIDQSLMD